MFRRLLILLLALAWVAGPAHCLSGRSAQAGMPICTPQGMVTVPWPGGPDTGHQAGGACAVCTGLGHAVLPVPPAMPAPALAWARAMPPPVPAAFHPPHPIHAAQPRAPPAA